MGQPLYELYQKLFEIPDNVLSMPWEHLINQERIKWSQLAIQYEILLNKREK